MGPGALRERDTAALNRLATAWVGLVDELHAAGIAHGDLQHANIMVTEGGDLKLVDYDCLAVPALMGRFNLEIGVEPYQHPTRGADTRLSPTLDRFSALMIWTAPKAFAADPTLWNRFVEPPNQSPYDKLLDPPRGLGRSRRNRSWYASSSGRAITTCRGSSKRWPPPPRARSTRCRGSPRRLPAAAGPANDPVFDKLRAAAAANAGRTLVALWDENAALVAGHPSVAALTPIVAGWRNRNRLCDAFLALARKPGADAGAVAVAWTALDRAGGHPEAEAYRQRIAAGRRAARGVVRLSSRAARRDGAFRSAATLPRGAKACLPNGRTPSANGRGSRKLANGSNWSPGCGRSIAPASRPNPASSRSWPAAGNCRPTMRRTWRRRSRLAIDRLTTLTRLRDLLRGAEVSDVAVAATWEELQKTGAESLVTPAERAAGRTRRRTQAAHPRAAANPERHSRRSARQSRAQDLEAGCARQLRRRLAVEDGVRRGGLALQGAQESPHGPRLRRRLGGRARARQQAAHEFSAAQ